MKKTCMKCHAEIPKSVYVKGRRVGLSARKFCLTCSPLGGGNRRSLEKVTTPEHKVCPKCRTEKLRSEFYTVSQYGKPRLSAYCRICMGRNSAQRNREIKQQAVAYLGGQCVGCQYSRCIDALDFHHQDAHAKKFTPSQSNLSFERLKSELDKCVLVCANCHREIHAGVREVPVP